MLKRDPLVGVSRAYWFIRAGMGHAETAFAPMSHAHRLSVILWIGLLVGSVVAVGPVAGQTGPADGDGTPVVVVFEDHPAKSENAITNNGGRVTGGQGVDVAPVLFARVNENAIEAIQRAPGVASVSRDIEVETFDQTVDWGVERVEGPTAADGVDESGTRVAVIDTGVDYDHEDFGDAVAWGANTVGDTTIEGRTAADDGNGHGTHVAGAVAARNNDRGVVGVAPQSSVYAMKALDDDGTGQVSDVIEAIDLAVKGPDGTVGTADDADVLSMSFGASSGSSALQDALAGASNHALLVAAAGNNGDGDPDTNTVSYPAKYESVIAVAATNRNDETTTWSAEGSEVELAAPGADISSTYPGDEYRSFSGTSMAAPHVSGTAALVIAGEQADDGEFDPALVRDRLQESTVDIESDGVDSLSGYGLLQADTAVNSNDPPAVEVTTPNDGATVSETVTVESNATDSQDADDALSVEVAVDNSSWESATYNETTGDYEWAWNTSTVAAGEHTVTSRATDSDGNTVTDSVTVTVETAGSPPTVVFENPEDGDGVSGTVPVRVAANDSETAASDLGVFYRVNDREWIEMSYDAENDRYEASWNTSAEADGDYVLGAYAVDADGRENATEIGVTVENETVPDENETDVPPGEQLAGLSQIVHAELEGDLEGRAFGQRIAQAATAQQRAEVVAEQRESIESRLDELEADSDDPARNARLQTLEDLSERSAAATDDLPAEAREANGIDREEFEQLQQRAAASRNDRGPPAGVGPDNAGAPDDSGEGEGPPADRAGEDERGKDASEDAGDRGPPTDAGGFNNTADDRGAGADSDNGRSDGDRRGQADEEGSDDGGEGSETTPGNNGETDSNGDTGSNDDDGSESSRSSPGNSGSESGDGDGSSSSGAGSSSDSSGDSSSSDDSSSGSGSNSGGGGSSNGGGGSSNGGGSGGNDGSSGGSSGGPGNGGGPP